LDVKKRLTEEQIIGFLREAEAGVAVKEPCRRHGFSKASYDLCRSKYGGMSVPEAKCLRASHCRPQTLTAMPRRAACGLTPLASHRAMN
jgi:putative transposase